MPPGPSIGHTPQHDFQAICNQITSILSNTPQVFFPPSIEYLSDNEHVSVSSSEASACSVEPGSTQDLGLILQIVGKSRTPFKFGVKSGGHSGNRGFSSTRGVQISLARFNTFNVNTQARTVELGPSLLWDDVYERLDPYGVTVIGGRFPGVGVGGLILGGGYSFKSNEHGLAIDNVVAFELVLPNGTVTTVTAKDHDLWFALRGGGNNFGIVTKFTINSYPQGQVWGGTIQYGSDQLGAVKNAIAEFSKVTDTNATRVSGFLYSSGEVIPAVLLFYNAPRPPSGIFDAFLRIPNQSQDILARSYTDFVKIQASQTTGPAGVRGNSCEFPTTNYSLDFLDAITDQHWGSKLTPLDPNVLVEAFEEPFHRSLFAHGTPSAYPPDRSLLYFPSVIAFTWSNSSLDKTMTRRAIRESADSLRAAALKDGQDVEHAAVYSNYALFDTPLEDMYGKNVPRLRALRRAVDPGDVMGLAGGFKF
ncbi:FAD-binding domain-containing protein [Lactarius akahatsu]|uniref:FAD-binding domain-containing protein n=1 Tax=Lactarius akahatsu TaxID=416441 RepID=A0AAD4L819_9AGAM|nr:FAD-binding domain-containing protein [Lactarius akahatsu]